MSDYEGNAIVYCEGAFGTTNGKTAHGLVRRCERYRILSVIDSRLGRNDAGSVLDGAAVGIPVVARLEQALEHAAGLGKPATHLVVGLAPDGGRLPPHARETIYRSVDRGLNVVCGLHDFLGDDPDLAALAAERGVELIDVRKPPPRSELHFFEGKLDQVGAARIALLGTDSAVGKRTTAWLLVDALNAAGRRAELVGTGQTAWLQGARYSIVLDSLVNDFVAGEIEHAVWLAWDEQRPQAIVIEGQGSLLNPAYPGGFEILAAARPHCVIMQHAPARRDYDGFPGHRINPLDEQIHAVEMISGRPVVAIAVNSEGLRREELPAACATITAQTGLPAVDPLRDGVEQLTEALAPFLARASG
jgi:uncharacterized NAD-dependent epimerase/dehydratase family protein